MFKQFTKRPEDQGENIVPLNIAASPDGSPARPRTEEPDLGPNQEERELIAFLELKGRLHDRLLDRLNFAVIDKIIPEDLRREVVNLVNEVLAEEKTPMRGPEFQRLVDELMHEVLGLGPLEPLLADPTINDILVNGHRNVFVERAGVLERTAVRFRDEKHLLRIIDKIVSRIGRRVDESQPWVDARLEDGSRVNAIIRPCAIDGPSV